MLINTHDCFQILYQLRNDGVDISDAVKEVVEYEKTPKIVVEELIKQNDPVVMFYINLNKKAHKIIKEILTCEGKSIATYVKIATSLITQSIITIEHIFQEDTQGQNNFIDCIGLSRLSDALSVYFKTGDCQLLIEAIHSNREDVRQILD